MLVYRSPWLGLHCRIFALYNTLKHVKSIHRQFTLRLTLQFITQHHPSALVASVKQRPYTPWSVITTVITFAFAVVFTACEACCIATRRIIIILTVSHCYSFCRRFSTTRPRHSNSDGTTLAECVNVSHINYALWCTQSCMETGRSTWWTLCGLCHNLPAGLINVQLKRRISIYRALKYIRIVILLLQLQLHGRGITWRLTFNGSPPFPPSRDISRFICLWLHISTTYAVGLHYVGPSLNVLSDQYNSYWIQTQTANSQVPSLHAVYTFTITILSRWKFNDSSNHAECLICDRTVYDSTSLHAHGTVKDTE